MKQPRLSAAIWLALCAMSACASEVDGDNATTITYIASASSDPSVAADHLQVANPPTTVDARNSIWLTVEAVDQSAHVAPQYSGTVSFQSTDLLATMPSQYHFSQSTDDGHKAFSLRMRTIGTQQITVKDNTMPNGVAQLQTQVVWPDSGLTTNDDTLLKRSSRIFAAVGRTWMVFVDPNQNLQLVSSIDGITWTTPTNLRANLPAWGDGLAVASNGNVMDYAVSGSSVGTPVYYRRATLHADGTLAWMAPEQNAVAGGSSFSNWYITLGIDAGGKPWLGYLNTDAAAGAGDYFTSQLTCSTRTDGVWSANPNLPVTTLSSNGFNLTYPIPLANGDVYVLTLEQGTTVAGQLWSNGALGPVESICASGCSGPTAAAMDNDVLLVFTDSNNVVQSATRSFSTGTISTPTPAPFMNSPMLSGSWQSGSAMGYTITQNVVYASVFTSGRWQLPTACVSAANLSSAHLYASGDMTAQSQVPVMVRDTSNRVSTVTCP